MEYFRLRSLCSFLYLSMIGRHALASSWEIWHAALPNTEMPKSLSNILQPAPAVNGFADIGKNVLNLNDELQGTTGKDVYSFDQPIHGKRIVVPHDVTTFFTDTELYSGKKMKLYFPKTINQANFLPRQAADSIPFSTQKFPEILNHFSVKPNSIEAKIMKQTIEECEVPSIKGEVKFCATSLEYLIEFSVSRLGRQVQVHSTEVVNEGTKQVYRIAQNGVEEIGDKSVICHKQNYVYAVFYCHEVNATRAYSVSLAASDGTKAKAVAVCHTDTRFWSPQHLAFQVLKVKPGTVPVCHFLPNGNLIWVTLS